MIHFCHKSRSDNCEPAVHPECWCNETEAQEDHLMSVLQTKHPLKVNNEPHKAHFHNHFCLLRLHRWGENHHVKWGSERRSGWCWGWQEWMSDGECGWETEEEVDGKRRLPSGSGSLAMLSSRRQRLNVSVWQAWYDNTHLEEPEKRALEIRMAGTGTHTRTHNRTHTMQKLRGNSTEVHLTGTDMEMCAQLRCHVPAEEQTGEMVDRKYLWGDESAARVNINLIWPKVSMKSNCKISGKTFEQQ